MRKSPGFKRKRHCLKERERVPFDIIKVRKRERNRVSERGNALSERDRRERRREGG